jgi:hypothetical protein
VILQTERPFEANLALRAAQFAEVFAIAGFENAVIPVQIAISTTTCSSFRM